MAEASIPVDLFNPGQVFACLGFMEAADVLIGDIEGGFDWSDKLGVRFVLRSDGEWNPFAVVLEFLAVARVFSQSAAGSSLTTEAWDVPTERLNGADPFPFPEPDSPATLPALLEGPCPRDPSHSCRLAIDYWGDGTRRDTVKFWGGAGGYPGAALARDAVDLVREHSRDVVSDPFGLSAEQSSSFRFDWRRDYIPIDIGFSLNSHKGNTEISAVGFPLVEVLAAVGLANARPRRMQVLEYRYGVIGSQRRDGNSAEKMLFGPSLVRAALGGVTLPFARRMFRMRLGWPAKEGQARAITTVTEENIR